MVGLPMKAVFLSASIPDPLRDPVYHQTGDVICIRDATEALVRWVLPRGRLVWGGHPAIGPFVRRIAERLGFCARIETWQSEFFRDRLPADTQALGSIRWVPAASDRESSLANLRSQMLVDNEFASAVFIGGMEGVEAEYRTFRSAHPQRQCFAIGSTGAAAQRLWTRHPHEEPVVQRRLGDDLAYDLLFEDLLGPLIIDGSNAP